LGTRRLYFIYTYIYIYTSANPCITCTEQSGAEQKLIPIKDEHEAAVFERPFRTQETNAPHGCGSSGTFRACCGSWAGSSGTRRAFCASGVARAAPVEPSAPPGQARAAPVEHSAAPEQTRAALFEYSAAPGPARAGISSHLRLRGKLEQHFSSILRLRGRLERPFRASCGSGPGASGHFEAAAAPGQARAAISSQLRVRLEIGRRTRANTLETNESLGIDIYILVLCNIHTKGN